MSGSEQDSAPTCQGADAEFEPVFGGLNCSERLYSRLELSASRLESGTSAADTPVALTRVAARSSPWNRRQTRTALGGLAP
jgi:hypothetical protein